MFKSYVLFWEHYHDFSSSSTRREFWWAFFWNWLIRIILLLSSLLFMGQNINYGFDAFLAYTVLTFIPSLALIARRYNDAHINRLLMYISCLAPYLAYGLVQRAQNIYTELAKIIMNLSAILFFVCLVVYIIVPMFPTASHHN